MPKEEIKDQAIIPSEDVVDLSQVVRRSRDDDDQRTASLVATTVATTLQHMDQQSGVSAEARRIAELAMTVLDGCGICLEGKMIVLHDGGIVADMMAVRAYEELQKAAGRLGVTQEEVSARIAEAFADHAEEVARQAQEQGIHVSPRGDPMLGPEDADRKGIFGGR